MSDRMIDSKAAYAVVEQVNTAVQQDPTLGGWDIYPKKTPDGIVGFGVAGPGDGAIPDPVMQQIKIALQANALTGASVTREF